MSATIFPIAAFHRTAAMSLVAVFAATVSSPGFAQQAPALAGQLERMIEYAQCVRENGYPDFPDPSPDGRLQFMFRSDQGSAEQLRAAQEACRDKLPSGLMQGRQDMSPERMESLLAFAQCMRAEGVAGFPDPNPDGTFEISDPNMNLAGSQARQTMETCREAHAVTSLMVRRAAPR